MEQLFEQVPQLHFPFDEVLIFLYIISTDTKNIAPVIIYSIYPPLLY